MQHIIRKQIIELDIPGGANSFEVQQSVRDYYLEKILPVLEQVFDELSDDEQTIYVEQLQIEIGNILQKNILENNWNKDIESAIKEQLRKNIGAKKATVVGPESTALNICKQWLYYMKNGFLPWNTLRPDNAWYQRVLEALATDFGAVSELRTLIRTNKDAVKRIVHQHREDFLVKLAELLSSKNQRELPKAMTSLERILQGLQHIDSTQAIHEAIQKNIWQQMIITAAVDINKPSSEQLIEKAIHYFLPIISRQKAIDISRKLLTGSSLRDLNKIRKDLSPLLKEQKQELPEQINTKDSEEDTIIETATEEIVEEGIFVLNAGCVLLHAFLPALFKRLQLAENGKFTDLNAWEKALFLTYYIPTGNTSAEEHELVIPKILCAWHLQKPIPKEIQLSADEISEADNMMRAAIENWNVLKNTSIGGLREGFLQRNGKLYSANGNLYLQVEQKGIDVLLDQLPWNLSIIKLPWMKQILRVEWR